MTQRPISILSVSLDRGLLEATKDNETQVRQLFYCQEIPARIVHLVKAPTNTPPTPLEFGDKMQVVPCAVPHWSLFLPFALIKGARLLQQGKFDFIQVQEPYLTGLIGVILSAIFKVPLISGLYSDEIDNPHWLRERWLNRIANRVARVVLRRSRAARADSLAVAERVAAGGYCPITFIPFLITHADRLMQPDPKATALRDTLLAGQTGPLLLAVNRLEPEKNMDLMLRAFARARQTQPEMVLAIAGTGRMAQELEARAQELAPDHIRWLGWVPATEMGAYYQAADVLLISSDRESAARVLSESLLAGTPVLSTDTAGAREVIEDQLSGRIVPVGDEKAFATALLEMVGDLPRLKQMGQNGLQSVKARVTAPAIAQALRTFYNKALGT